MTTGSIDEIILLDDGSAKWEINMEGDIQGTYTGYFKFKCYLPPTQRIAADKQYREMLGGNITFAPEHESLLAYILSQLKQRVITAPPFWTSTVQGNGVEGDIPDENVLMAIMSAASNAEVKYRDQLKKRKEEALERAKKATEMLFEKQKAEAAKD